jgi:hypothetical protein
VIVANIQMKNLKIEAEKGFRRTLFEPEWVGPNWEINFDNGVEAYPRGVQEQLYHLEFIEREIAQIMRDIYFKEPGETHKVGLISPLLQL